MRKWFFGLLGSKTIDPASVIHNWRNQVVAMVPGARFPAIWREILNGHLSIMDLKYGIHSSAERSLEHQDALKYRAQHEESAGPIYPAHAAGKICMACMGRGWRIPMIAGTIYKPCEPCKGTGFADGVRR